MIFQLRCPMEADDPKITDGGLYGLLKQWFMVPWVIQPDNQMQTPLIPALQSQSAGTMVYIVAYQINYEIFDVYEKYQEYCKKRGEHVKHNKFSSRSVPEMRMWSYC